MLDRDGVKAWLHPVNDVFLGVWVRFKFVLVSKPRDCLIHIWVKASCDLNKETQFFREDVVFSHKVTKG